MNILGNIFVNQNGDIKMHDLNQFRFIGLYFSAAWCGPCRYFTPSLKKFYNQINKENKNNLEILFCSSDHTERYYNIF